jgi:chromosome segregation ATPase
MSYITRNANILLLFLIILSSTALVGATVYFQSNFDKINEAYGLKLEQLNKISEELDKQKVTLESVSSELTIKTAREQQLGEQYQVVQSEKDTLKGANTQLTTQKNALESELIETESALTSAQNSLEAERALSTSLAVEVDDLTVDKNALAGQRDDLQTEVSCLRSANETEEAGC